MDGRVACLNGTGPMLACAKEKSVADGPCATEEPGPAPRKDKALEFFIFGHPVTMSPSPDIHNEGFAKNGFPHRRRHSLRLR